RPNLEAAHLRQWQHATKTEPVVESDSTARITFDAASEELIAAWPVDTPVSLTVTLPAIAGLTLCARWLPGIGPSSVPYLLKNLIRRPGTIQISATEIVVRLKPGAVDIVLEMAGYLRKIESVSWLDGRNVRFQIEGSGR